MTREEQRRLDRLHAQAEQTAAALYARALLEPIDSPRLARLKTAAKRAGNRAERRYRASLAP